MCRLGPLGPNSWAPEHAGHRDPFFEALPPPLCQLEPPGSFREAWLAQLHEGNNPDRCLSLQELRVRFQETNKPIPPETLQHRSAREVLLLELDSSPARPIPIEGTKLVLDGDLITDAWNWHDLLDRSFNNEVVDVQVVYMSKQATDR